MTNDKDPRCHAGLAEPRSERNSPSAGKTTANIASAVDRPAWRWYAFGLLAIAAGAALRLIWSGDIEYKYDESYMFQRAINAGIRERFPLVGMSSGAGVANPGLSVWLFIAMARLFRVQTPPDLARVVQLTNVTALVLAMVLAFVIFERKDWRAWVWAIALACVNPFAILFDRKIWAQSVLPLFCVVAIVGWWKRDTRWGAFAWGLVAMLLGQIHMSGFFLTVAILIWTVRHERAERSDSERVATRWRSCAAGALVGTLTLIPWLAHVIAHGTAARHQDWLAVLAFHNMFGLWYWILWISGALGLGMSYSLGASEFAASLKYPLIAGEPSYLMAVAHAILFALGAWLLVSRALPSRTRPVSGVQTALGSGDQADRLLNAGLLGCGLLLTASGFPIHRHYLIVAFPLVWLWLARHVRVTTRHWNQALALIWICELLISVGFRQYIHVNHGAVTGDFGRVYAPQPRMRHGNANE